MQAINGIQIATINTNAGMNIGMVADAANAHRSYLLTERPDFLRPEPRVVSSPSVSDPVVDLKQRSQQDVGTDSGTAAGSMCSNRIWRFDNRHLPGAAWAMLVLNPALCG